MNFEELKQFCDKKAEQILTKEHVAKYKKEIIYAKRFYSNGRNLYNELIEKKDKVDNRYFIPFLLGITDKIEEKDFDFIQVKEESSSPDFDSDSAPSGKELIRKYFKEKYGEEKVITVGTQNTLGLKSACKDLLRLHRIEFKASNDFSAMLNDEFSWEANIENIKNTNSTVYNFYLSNKEILDLVPEFTGRVRQVSQHAGGIVITDEPFYKYAPVDRATGEVVSAYPESGQEMVLDECGLIKIDQLSITVLDTIQDTVRLTDGKIFLIEEDEIKKIVPESYIKEREKDVNNNV